VRFQVEISELKDTTVGSAIVGQATNAGIRFNYGGRFHASSGDTNVGVLGSAFGSSSANYGGVFGAQDGTNNFAVYASPGNAYFGGSVGIGTEDPKSMLHVVGNFIQIPAIVGPPFPTDCDSDEEAGRFVVNINRSENYHAYLCTGFRSSRLSGWVGISGGFLD
jgi:hypothetical protein